MTNKKEINRDGVYKAKNPEELRIKYDQWCAKYNEDLGIEHVQMIQSMVNWAEQILGGRLGEKTQILDVACGTGLVGKALSEIGCHNIDGIDISEGMISEAQKLKVYNRIYQENLLDSSVLLENAPYDVLIAIAMFSYGHPPFKTLLNMDKFLITKGVIIFSARKSYYLENQSEHADVIQQLGWKNISKHNFRSDHDHVAWIFER